MNLKSHFRLDPRQRSGILLLVLVVILSWTLYFLSDHLFLPNIVHQDSYADFESQIDSMRQEHLHESKTVIHPFNPNYITDYKGYTLGMRVEEIDRLLRFRESGKWINSAEAFQKVTGVSDSLLGAIAPYFKFPEWVTQPKPKPAYSTYDKPAGKARSDLNAVAFKALTNIKGVDEKLARDIIAYRHKLGGFLDDKQLYDVYGLSSAQAREILLNYTVKSKPEVDSYNVNTASASDLSTVPFITFKIAREIVDYRVLHEGINDLDELLKIEGITPYKLARIKLYLSSNQN